MRKFFAIAVLVPLAIVIVMFAVANREIIAVSFDPFDSAHPALALKMPLFMLIFVLVAVGVVVGGIAAWLQAAQVADPGAAGRGRGARSPRPARRRGAAPQPARGGGGVTAVHRAAGGVNCARASEQRSCASSPPTTSIACCATTR